jgi:hypothetical protein
MDIETSSYNGETRCVLLVQLCYYRIHSVPKTLHIFPFLFEGYATREKGGPGGGGPIVSANKA